MRKAQQSPEPERKRSEQSAEPEAENRLFHTGMVYDSGRNVPGRCPGTFFLSAHTCETGMSF